MLTDNNLDESIRYILCMRNPGAGHERKRCAQGLQTAEVRIDIRESDGQQDQVRVVWICL